MIAKNVTAFFLTGLFLINLFVLQSNVFFQVVTGKEVTVINPYCEKSKSLAETENTYSLNLSNIDSLEIPVICTNVFHFKAASFTLISAEDNFKEYLFSDSFHLNLPLETNYLPPQV